MSAIPINNWQVLFRFGLAFVLSFAFGIARQRMGKPIGFGTFIFVSLGSCALALVAEREVPENPLPLLSAIVTGIGFLGAGALFRTSDRIVGFTSAATIWAFAVVGLAIGVGELLTASLLYASLALVTAIDHRLERGRVGAHKRRLRIEIELGSAESLLSDIGLPPREEAQSISADRDRNVESLTFGIDRRMETEGALYARLEAHQLVRGYHVE